MKTKLNSILNLSLKSIEAKARKAAMNAELKAKEEKQRKPRKAVPKKSRPAIDLEINSIFQALKNNAPESEIVVLERADRSACCKARICVYVKADILRQNEEEKIFRQALAAGTSRTMLNRPFRACASVVYALYDNTLHPDRLGSVAIYTNNPHAMLSRIEKSGRIFGHRICQASIELGRRPFIDVILSV